MKSTSLGLLQRAGIGVAFLISLLFVLFVQFRAQIFNDFTVLYGDRYDAAIMTAIFEHWVNVLHADAPWSQLYYFYPYTKTLGHTDGYFLIGLVYALVRPFTADPFISSELTNVVIKALGFVTFYVATRRMFGWSGRTALLGAALFTLSNSLTVHGQRIQLATLAFAPLLALLMWETVQALYAQQRKRLAGYGTAAALLLGAWSITCFYLTWFFIFFSLFVVALLLFGASRSERRVFFAHMLRQKLALAWVALVTLVALLPLLTVYLPKSRETGMRPLETVLGNTVPWQGILQIGNENLLFGKIYNRWLAFVSPTYTPNGEYYNTGIAPLLFVLFLCGCWLVLRKAPVGTAAAHNPLLRAVAGATLITWLLTLNIGGYSAWALVYYVIPGARALSVVTAYQIFLVFPVLVLALHYLRHMQLRGSLLAIIALLLCLEELNDGYIALVRADEVARVSVVAPPSACRAFFASGWQDQAKATPMPEWINTYYAHNVSAMLIAELHRLPTVNGIASFNPPDWNFDKPNDPDYEARIRAYAQKHQISGLCRLNLVEKRWDSAW